MLRILCSSITRTVTWKGRWVGASIPDSVLLVHGTAVTPEHDPRDWFVCAFWHHPPEKAQATAEEIASRRAQEVTQVHDVVTPTIGTLDSLTLDTYFGYRFVVADSHVPMR